MSGRVRVHEDQDRTAEEVIAELLDAALLPEADDRATRPTPSRSAHEGSAASGSAGRVR